MQTSAQHMQSRHAIHAPSHGHTCVDQDICVCGRCSILRLYHATAAAAHRLLACKAHAYAAARNREQGRWLSLSGRQDMGGGTRSSR